MSDKAFSFFVCFKPRQPEMTDDTLELNFQKRPLDFGAVAVTLIFLREEMMMLLQILVLSYS